jgi:hypothetical protein
MTEPIRRLVGVTSSPAGSLVEYSEDSGTAIYFFDANRNQQLDANDKKLIETPQGEHAIQLRSSSVTANDIRRHGREAAAQFAQAERERKELQKTLPSFRQGKCFFTGEGLGDNGITVEGLRFDFQPPLSVKTLRAGPEKLYQVADLLQWKDRQPAMDPGRCFKAQANHSQKAVAGKKLQPQEIQLSTADLFFDPALATLGIKNGGGVDAAYQLENGIQRFHVDL